MISTNQINQQIDRETELEEFLLGEEVEKTFEELGIKKGVEWLSNHLGIDCGCDNRKEWLNQKFEELSKKKPKLKEYARWLFNK